MDPIACISAKSINSRFNRLLTTPIATTIVSVAIAAIALTALLLTQNHSPVTLGHNITAYIPDSKLCEGVIGGALSIAAISSTCGSYQIFANEKKRSAELEAFRNVQNFQSLVDEDEIQQQKHRENYSNRV